MSPLSARRWENFKANRRGYWSLWIFLALFVSTLRSELIANDKPILIRYDNAFYTPIFQHYAETEFGGEFELEAEYRDPYVQALIMDKGWMIWPLIPWSYDTIDYELEAPAPSPPSSRHWLGTDDQARDVLARVVYGFRISALFGLLLTLLSSVIGIAAGAVQGYFGGLTDLIMQRFIEVWGRAADTVPADYYGCGYRTRVFQPADPDAVVFVDRTGRCGARRVSACSQL